MAISATRTTKTTRLMAKCMINAEVTEGSFIAVDRFYYFLGNKLRLAVQNTLHQARILARWQVATERRSTGQRRQKNAFIK